MKSTAIIVFLSLILYVGSACAEETTAGFVKNVSGQASIKRNQTSIPARVGDKLFESDIVVTGPDGRIGLIFQDNGLLGIGPNSQVNLSKFAFEPANKKLAFFLNIKRGTMVYLSGLIAKLDSKNVRFETPTAACGIRGTHMAIKVGDGNE
jgi:hypothetical protein